MKDKIFCYLKFIGIIISVILVFKNFSNDYICCDSNHESIEESVVCYLKGCAFLNLTIITLVCAARFIVYEHEPVSIFTRILAICTVGIPFGGFIFLAISFFRRFIFKAELIDD